jgi:hypothetical protein
MLNTLRSDDFRPYLNLSFRVRITMASRPPQLRELELVEVSEARYTPSSSDARRPFSLIFRDTAGGVLPQSIYTLEHSALGSLEIFLVPIAARQDGTQYQAIFN